METIFAHATKEVAVHNNHTQRKKTCIWHLLDFVSVSINCFSFDGKSVCFCLGSDLKTAVL